MVYPSGQWLPEGPHFVGQTLFLKYILIIPCESLSATFNIEILSLFIFFKIYFLIHFREREYKQVGGKGRETENPKVDFELNMEPSVGLDPRTLRP